MKVSAADGRGTIGGIIGAGKSGVAIARLALDAGYPDEQLKTGITSHMFVGDSRVQALKDYYPSYHRYLSPEANGGRGQMESLAGGRGALMVVGPTEITEFQRPPGPRPGSTDALRRRSARVSEPGRS